MNSNADSLCRRTHKYRRRLYLLNMTISKTPLFAAILILTVAGAAPALAEQTSCPTCDGDPAEMAAEARLQDIPLSLWLDSDTYAMNEVVTLTGHVANISPGQSITIKVVDPAGNTVLIDQLDVDAHGEFEVQYAASSWTSPGIYHLMAQYGSPTRDNKVQFELVESDLMEPAATGCGSHMLTIEDICVPYDIRGAKITDVTINSDYNSLILHVSAYDDGKLHIEFPNEVISDVFMVMVNDEESNDSMIDGQSVGVYFLADTQSIEFIGSKVIPEFGTIAVLVLAISIISIIVVSTRTQVSLIPRL